MSLRYVLVYVGVPLQKASGAVAVSTAQDVLKILLHQ